MKCIPILFSLIIHGHCLQAQYNTATGFNALFYNSSGNANTATGGYSLYATTNYWSNSAHGAYSLYTSNGAEYNCAYGSRTLNYTTTGSYNVAMGYQALFGNQSGHYNTAVGRYAVNHGETNYNTGVGETSLYTTLFGANNVGAGDGAGWINSSGSFNTYIGYNTDNTITNTNYYYTTVIGARTYIDVTQRILAGNIFYVSEIGGWVTWTNFSDSRIKTQIKENVPGLSFIKLLRPVTYKWDLAAYGKLHPTPAKPADRAHTDEEDEPFKQRIAMKIHSGFIAQEVEEAAGSLAYDFSGVDKPTGESLYGLRYEEFVVPLVKAVQELNDKKRQLSAKISLLTAMRDKLRVQIDLAKQAGKSLPGNPR